MAGPSTTMGLLALSILLALATLGVTQDATTPPAPVPAQATPPPPSTSFTSLAGSAAPATHSPITNRTGIRNDTEASTTAIPSSTAFPLPKCTDRNVSISGILGGGRITIEIMAKTIPKSPNDNTSPAGNTTANDNATTTTNNPFNNSSVTNGSPAPTAPSTTPVPSPTTPSPTPDLYEYEVRYMDGSAHLVSETFINTQFDLKELKPCSQYDFTVIAFINGKESCQMTPPSYTTGVIDKDTFKPIWNKSAKKLCFESPWLISEDKRCFRSNASCEMGSYTVGPDKCSVTIDQHTPPVDDMKLTYEKKLPLKIQWGERPEPECSLKDLIVSCTDAYLTHKDYKPFQSYNCTGTYNTTGFNITKEIVAEIECEVDIVLSEGQKLSTSIAINIQHHSSCLQWIDFYSRVTFYIECKNQKTQQEVYADYSQHTVSVTGLEPFTDYTCTVTPRYNKDQSLQKAKDIPFKTDADKPIHPGSIHSKETSQNNALRVTCDKVKNWNGHPGHYEATIKPEHTNLKSDKTCDFTFEDLSYSTDYTITIVAVNKEGHRSYHKTYGASTGYNDKALIGVLAFLIILTSIALLFVLYKIYVLQKQRNKTYCVNAQPLLTIPSPADPLMTVEPIAAETLLDVYKKKIADEGRLFLAEFQSVPRIFSNFTVKVAKNPENQAKNRYVDILPYDYNRVQLTSNGGEPGADYINASFIEGFKEQKKYIAAQGPKEETMADFWRMVWEQKSSIIVMVTRCEEGNRSKCAQYWPSMDRETEIYGDFVLKIKKEDTCPDYIIRHLTIINRKDKAEREVTHIQFTSWPDHGVPSEPHLLLKLRRRVNSFSNLFSGPIVVHCSAGVGRTGTYIGIDAMLESLDSEGVMDIYGYVVKMRRQRCLMVQVEAQYILIHQALIEFNQFGDTEISLAELHSCLSGLHHRDSTSEPTMMEVEFQRLPKYRNWRTFNTAVSEENKKKNRYSTAIPYDFNRVLVKLEEEKSNDDEDDDDDDDDDYSSDDDDEEDSTQYINATYIDGYWSPRSLIAAQGPLEDTVPEFWQMVYQKRVKNIVMLSQCTEGNEELCAEYWSKEKKSYKDISVEETACISSAAYTKRTLQLQHAKRKDSRQVQQYHFQGWPEKSVKKTEETDDKKEEEKRDGLPDHPQELVELVRSIKKTIGNTRAERSTPVLVHCHDGTSRTGVFCALWNIVDSATTENLVDIFQVCKSLRKERQGMIADYEQYQFLYKAVEGAFPAQNGEVKQTPAPAPAADSLQIISEVPASATTDDHQVEPKDAATAAEPKEDTQKEKKEEKEADGAIETISLLPEGGASEASEQSSSTDFLDSGSSANGPTITVEV